MHSQQKPQRLQGEQNVIFSKKTSVTSKKNFHRGKAKDMRQRQRTTSCSITTEWRMLPTKRATKNYEENHVNKMCPRSTEDYGGKAQRGDKQICNVTISSIILVAGSNERMCYLFTAIS